MPLKIYCSSKPILFGESFLQNKVKRACFIKRYVYVNDDIPMHMRASLYYTMSYGKSTMNLITLKREWKKWHFLKSANSLG